MAQNAISDFSDYLRGNLDALRHSEPIPFSKELDHVRVYLSLEKMRFDDELEICYDIETTNFSIPLLTLQPLVENAVKHGVGKTPNGGKVTIKTREHEDDFEIIVMDNGVGFDVAEKKADGRSHIGIENVRSRLSIISNATLTLKSEKEIGTISTIKIPKCGNIGGRSYENPCSR